jgi:hypothetical protein
MIEVGERLLFLAGVPPRHFQKCLEWAFGKIDPGESLEDLRIRWNKKHGKIFVVDQKDSFKAFIWSVGKAYVLTELPRPRLVLPQRFVGGVN